MPNTTVQLTYPVQHGGQDITRITLRRPRVRDIERLDKLTGDTRRSVTLLSDLSGQPPEAIREIDAGDFKKLGEVVQDFLGDTPPIPGSSAR